MGATAGSGSTCEPGGNCARSCSSDGLWGNGWTCGMGGMGACCLLTAAALVVSCCVVAWPCSFCMACTPGICMYEFMSITLQDKDGVSGAQMAAA